MARQRAAARKRAAARSRDRAAAEQRAAALTESRARASWALAGTEQDGLSAGSAEAGATLSVYTDLRCKACVRFETTTLPNVLRRYVATGALRLRIRVAPPAAASSAMRRSVRRRAALLQAAGTRQLAVNLLLAWGERWAAGFASPSAALADVDGLDVAAVEQEARSSAVLTLVRQDEARFKRVGVGRTPTFLLDDGTGAKPRRLRAAQTTPARMLDTLAGVLGE